MVERGEYTLTEIQSQPVVWKDALAAFRRQSDTLDQLWQPYSPVIFTGCGSTHYLSLIGAALFQSLTGIPAQARPASEIVLFPDLVFLPNTKPLLMAVSRSGATTETIDAVQLFRARTGSPAIVVTCYGDSPLAKEADLALVVPEAQEESIAQTRSFSSMAVIVEALAAHIGRRGDSFDRLPQICGRLLTEYHDVARGLGENAGIERFFFLGSGLLYGLACEAMLKMKEMSLSYSEAYHTLEFRHGPMSMVDDRTLVVGLISEDAAEHEIAVLRQMRERGAHTLAVVEQDRWSLAGWSRVVTLQSGLPVWMRPILYLPVLQLMAYYRAMSRGQNPDRPANLEAVVSLKSLRA